MKTRVLMVCLGNICRSPLAEGILKNKVDSKTVFVDSAGTAGYHVGHKPDERSIKVASKHNINIKQQRCRKFNTSDFDDFDLIYVMDVSNYENVIKLARNNADKTKVSLLLSVSDQENTEVPDPYYGGQNGFEHVFQLIDKACTIIATNLK